MRIDLTNYFKRDVNELYKKQQKVFGEQLQKELANNPEVEVDMSDTIKRIAYQKRGNMLEPSLAKVLNENPTLRKYVENEMKLLEMKVDTTDYVYKVYGKDISKTLSRLSQLSQNKSSVMYPARELAREFSLGVSEKLPGLQQSRAEYADFMSYYDKLKNMSGQAITKSAKSGSFASPEAQAAYDKVVTGGVKESMSNYKQLSQEIDDFNRSVDDMLRNGTPEQRTAFQKAYGERMSALKSAKGQYEQAMKDYHGLKKSTHRDYQAKKKDWQGKVNKATDDYSNALKEHDSLKQEHTKLVNDYKLKMHRKTQNDRIMKTVGVTAATALGIGGVSRLAHGVMSVGD